MYGHLDAPSCLSGAQGLLVVHCIHSVVIKVTTLYFLSLQRKYTPPNIYPDTIIVQLPTIPNMSA